MTEATQPEQALLYRLSGDLNPLHADPTFASLVGFEQGPILHGLCTYGFLARAVIQQACGGDGRRLKGLTAQFRKPVWPGETIRTDGYTLGDGRIVLQAFRRRTARGRDQLRLCRNLNFFPTTPRRCHERRSTQEGDLCSTAGH